jgi:hypothetical protein
MRRSLTHPSILVMAIIAVQCWLTPLVHSQGRSAQVTVTPTADKVIAWSAAGGGVEESLQPGESVVASGARGHTGFVQTSTRLLGFSAGLRQWREVSLGVEERIVRHQLLPFLILAHSNQQVYGFQETRGHWTELSLGPNEKVVHLRGHGHVAVAITNERAHWGSRPTPAVSSTSAGRRKSASCRSTAVRTAWSSGPRPAPSSSSRNPRDGPRCDSESRPYIRPSSSSIASTQVVAGGSAVTGTPRFVAMSCRRP